MAGPQFVYVMKGLSKTYPGGKQVLKDIWLSFYPGAKIGIVGINGSGKSTLMKIMAGMDKEFTGDAWAADVVVKVAPPTAEEVAKLHSGQTLIGFLAPRNADNSIGALKAAGVQAFALEAIPRISRAQAMDALSSQGNVAG